MVYKSPKLTLRQEIVSGRLLKHLLTLLTVLSYYPQLLRCGRGLLRPAVVVRIGYCRRFPNSGNFKCHSQQMHFHPIHPTHPNELCSKVAILGSAFIYVLSEGVGHQSVGLTYIGTTTTAFNSH